MNLLITVICALLLSACSVTNMDIKQAEYICKSHAGISEIKADCPLVVCADGTQMTLSEKNLKGFGG